MGLNVLVISDEAVEKGSGEMFDCLFRGGFEKVYHVGVSEAVESYLGTNELWAVVIIDREDCEDLIERITKIRGKQIVVVMNGWFDAPVRMPYGFDLPRDAQMLERVLKQLGIGGTG